MTRVLPDVDKCLAGLMDPFYKKKPSRLSLMELHTLCCHCKDIFLSEPMLLEPDPPLVIVGRLHGYFDQLVKLLERCGGLPDTHYLFLGGYVNKGKRSIDTITLLFTFKSMYPDSLFLLRGCDEDASMCRYYGFYEECQRQFNIKLWKAFVEAFNCMPVCALIRGKIFCVSSGLSPDMTDLACIRQLKRPYHVPENGLLCDLLWGVPEEQGGWSKGPFDISYAFGEDVVKRFVEEMGLELIVRGNQHVVDGGYVP